MKTKFRIMKQSAAAVLCLALILTCVSLSANALNGTCVVDTCGGSYINGFCSANDSHIEAASANSSGFYEIDNAGKLYWFAALVNSGANEYEAGDNGEVYNAVLTADIVVNENLLAGLTYDQGGEVVDSDLYRSWTPIGLYTGATEYIRYSGTFDGDGHSISGLYYNNKDHTGRMAGLFGCLDSNGIVRNVGVVDSYIRGFSDTSGLVSTNYGGTISNCYTDATIRGTGTTGGIVSRNKADGTILNCTNRGAVTGAGTGGIAGENEKNASIENCSNSGTVSGSSSVGGVAGVNRGTIDNCHNSAEVIGSSTHIGGVAGNHNAGTISRSSNSGSVSGESDYIGGVAGLSSGSTISDSHNTGSVTGSDQSDSVGGVAGEIDGTYNAPSTVTGCYNTGSVSGKGWVGGIVGIAGYQNTTYSVAVENCYNTGAVSGNTDTAVHIGGVVGSLWNSGAVRNCYNTGSVVGYSQFGAVIGYLSNGTVADCYYQADAETDTLNGTTAKNAEAFASGEAAWTMNGSANTGDELVWYQAVDIDGMDPDASPVLDDSHGIVYYGYINCTEIGYTNNADYGNPGDHAYGDPSFRWSKEGTAAEAVFTCTVCEEDTEGHALTVVAKVETEESTAENCQENGTTVYTATVELNGKTYTDTNSVDGAKGPHVDADSDNACDLCGESMGKPTDPKPTDPKPSEPEEDEPKYELPECGMDEDCVLSQFSDVKIDDWYHDGVHFCVDHGIVNGMGNGTFAPNDPTTRAQLVTMLYRLEGEPSIEGLAEPFTDVSENDWFYAPIVWAYNNKVVNGMTETTFAPDAKITREQVATILHRYLGTPAGSGELSGYPDADKVQDYAKDALTWAVGEGLINGVAQTDGTSLLAPDGNATRAQIATILMRYLTA